MNRGYLIFEDIIGLVITYDDCIVLAKTYAPIKTNLCRLCSDIKSAGENAEWYCTFTESAVPAEKSIVRDVIEEKNVGVLQSDFDIIKFILKECGIYEKVPFVPMLQLYAQNMNNAACLYSVGGSIFAAVVSNGLVKAVDAIPFSNYNMYLSKLANVCSFDTVVNMDNYPDAQDGYAHLETIVEWMNAAEYVALSGYEDVDLGHIDDERTQPAIQSAEAELMRYDDEEVISFGERSNAMSSDTFRPQRAERPTRDGGTRRVERPRRVAQEQPQRTERPKRSERPQEQERPKRGERPQRPQREEVSERPQRTERPRRPQRAESKAIKSKSNAMFVFLGILFLASAVFDGGNRMILQVATEKTAENIEILNAASSEMQGEIDSNIAITDLLTSYDTIADKLS